MFCRYCGKGSDENANFCRHCGASLTSATQTADVVEMDTIVDTKIPDEKKAEDLTAHEGIPGLFVFDKDKMMGNITYRSTHTEVEVRADGICIHQEIRRFFFIKRQREEDFPLSSIRSASIHTRLDFWDTLYGIIFAICGLYSPWCFLLAAIFLYCGYGKVITFDMTDGSRSHIPLKGNIEDAEKLIHHCG